MSWDYSERRNYDEFARTVLGDERYNNSPCNAHPFELIELYVRELEETVAELQRDRAQGT